jgi:osmotically-inducible protein OsmY
VKARPCILGFAAALLLPSCSPASSARLAGEDQEITRDILWALQQDPAGRFTELRVSCLDRRIALEGRVSTLAEAREASRIAEQHARGAFVDARLDIRRR